MTRSVRSRPVDVHGRATSFCVDDEARDLCGRDVPEVPGWFPWQAAASIRPGSSAERRRADLGAPGPQVPGGRYLID